MELPLLSTKPQPLVNRNAWDSLQKNDHFENARNFSFYIQVFPSPIQPGVGINSIVLLGTFSGRILEILLLSLTSQVIAYTLVRQPHHACLHMVHMANLAGGGGYSSTFPGEIRHVLRQHDQPGTDDNPNEV